MECLIGIQFKDFVLLASDQTYANSIIVMKANEDKMFKISNKICMAISGEAGDTCQFAEYVCKNIQLYKMRNTYEISLKEAAHYTRRVLAETLRTRDAYHVNLLLAGYDDTDGPHLYYMDYLASAVSVKYAAHGYGGIFSLSILDRHYSPNMSREEGYKLMEECVKEVHRRLIINLPNFQVKIIDKNGINEMPPITAFSLKKD